MRILLIFSTVDAYSLRKPIRSSAAIHLGLSYISAVLKSRGHTTRLVVLGDRMERGAMRLVNEALTEFQPQIAGFTSVASQYPFISRMAQFVRKEAPDVFLVAGGCHVSLNPDECIQGGFDAICVGEGEYPMAELADEMQNGKRPQGIANLWIRRDDGTIEKNAPRPFTDDLNSLPFPDREIWREWIKEEARTEYVILVGRGCPFNCSYCSNHALRRLAAGRYVRFRTPSEIVNEVRFVNTRYPGKDTIYLQAETIGLDRSWLSDLCMELKKCNATLEKPLKYACNYRITPELLKDEVFEALESANVKTIEIGLESGSERIRRDVLRRNYSNDDFLKAVALARTHGMKVNVYNMIGVPGETPADHEETVLVNRRACPDEVYTSIFFPYPGTDLCEECRRLGVFGKAVPMESVERRKAMLDMPGFSRSEIQRAFDWFDYRVYEGNRPLHFRLRRVVRRKIGSNALAYQLFLRLLPVWHSIRYIWKS